MTGKQQKKGLGMQHAQRTALEWVCTRKCLGRCSTRGWCSGMWYSCTHVTGRWATSKENSEQMLTLEKLHRQMAKDILYLYK